MTDSEKSNKAKALDALRDILARVEGGLHEFYVTPYRRSFARAQRARESGKMIGGPQRSYVCMYIICIYVCI